MGYVYFDDTLDFISKVTKFLNQTVPGCTVDGIGLEVRLVDWNSGKAEVIGEWSDEIASDNWSYEEKWNPDALAIRAVGCEKAETERDAALATLQQVREWAEQRRHDGPSTDLATVLLDGAANQLLHILDAGGAR